MEAFTFVIPHENGERSFIRFSDGASKLVGGKIEFEEYLSKKHSEKATAQIFDIFESKLLSKLIRENSERVHLVEPKLIFKFLLMLIDPKNQIFLLSKNSTNFIVIKKKNYLKTVITVKFEFDDEGNSTYFFEALANFEEVFLDKRDKVFLFQKAKVVIPSFTGIAYSNN